MDQVQAIFTELGVSGDFLYQFVIVAIMFVISRSLFFNKLQFVLENRIEKTSKLEESADETFDKANELQSKYKEKIDEAYKEAQKIVTEKKATIVRNETANYKTTEQEIEAYIETSRKEAVNDINQKKTAILAQADDLANELMTKIIK